MKSVAFSTLRQDLSKDSQSSMPGNLLRLQEAPIWCRQGESGPTCETTESLGTPDRADDLFKKTQSRKLDSVYNLDVMRDALQKERTSTSHKEDKWRDWLLGLLVVIHPENKYRMAWDCMLLILIFYMGIMVPIDLGLTELKGRAWEVWDVCTVTFFVIDMVLNFNSAYYDSYGRLEDRRCRIAQRYLRTWFVLDFLSTFPFDSLVQAGQSGNSIKGTELMRLPRVVKMVRLARLMRLARVRGLLQKIFGLHLVTNMIVIFSVRFMSLFLALLLVTHWLSCAFCAVADWEEDEDIAKDIYGIEKGDTPLVGWEFDGVNAMDMPPARRYYAAFYFVFCSLLLKPQDVIFRTSYCRYFFMLFGFIKPVVGASIMGVLTQMIVSHNNKRGNLELKIQAIGIFMQKKRVPLNIQHQVLAYLEHAEKQMETLQDLDAIKSLSPTLRLEVAYTTNHENISKFALWDSAFGKSFVRQLCGQLKLELFGPDDVIAQEGHPMTFMAFVNTGSLRLFKIKEEVTKKDSVQSRQLSERGAGAVFYDDAIEQCGEVSKGQSFGAEALLWPSLYKARRTALCLVFCELSTLKREDFVREVERSPVYVEILDQIRTVLRNSEDTEATLKSFENGDEAAIQAINNVVPEPAGSWGVDRQSSKQRNSEETDIFNAALLQESLQAHEKSWSKTVSSMENKVSRESSTMRREVGQALLGAEERLLHRVEACEERLEARLLRMEEMLRGALNPSNFSSVRNQASL